MKIHEIQLRDAKAGLSALIDAAACGKAAVITRHGKPEAVILGYQDWLRLSQVPSFARLLMAVPDAIHDLEPRDNTPAREVDL